MKTFTPLYRLVAAGVMAAVMFNHPLDAHAASDTWNQPGGSHTWNSGANWLSGTQYPDGAGDVAYFTNNITSGQTVTISPAVTVGGIVVGDADGSHVFTIGASGQTLNIDNGGSATTINNITTFNQILANVTATGANKDLIVNVSGSELDFGSSGVDSVLTIHDLTKNGPGILFLWNKNTGFTGSNITFNAGTAFLDSNALPTNGVVTLGSGSLMAVGGGRSQTLAEVRGLGEIGTGGSQLIVGNPTGVTRGEITIASGGRLRPGDVSGPGGIGSLFLGDSGRPSSPEFEIGSKTYFDLAGYASFDRIDSQRTFTIVNGGDIYLNFLGGFQPTNGAAFNLFYDDSTRGYQDLNGGKVFDNIFNTSTGLTNFFYADDGFTATLGGDPTKTSNGGPDSEDPSGLGTPFITFTYFIPEPSVTGLLFMSGAALLLRRRRI